MGIELKNINKTYGIKESLINVLSNINLKINDGEMVAIVGPSGSGKSTLLNIIGTIDQQTSGQYILNNINIDKLKSKEIAKLRNKTFGFIFQYFGLINDISVYKNIRIPLEYSKCSSSEANHKIDSLLKDLKIIDKKKATPKQLSGGQCQRVAIARALVNEPEIILADEPTGALDKHTSMEIMDIFNEINNKGKTVIIVTHDLDIAYKCSRIIKIEDGVIVSDEKIKK